MSLQSIEAPAFLGVGLVLLSALAGILWAAQVQRDSTVSLVVQEGQSLRQIAEHYLGDPDLWQEIWHTSRLEFPAQVELGATLTLNAQAVPVAADGRFATTLPLQPGVNRFQLKVSDIANNVTERQGSVIYMPDEPAFIGYADDLPKIDTKHFLTPDHEFFLRGWTNPKAKVEVDSLNHDFKARTYASANGNFQVPLQVSAAQEPFRLKVTRPSGHATEDRFLVSRDTAPPTLTVIEELPRITAKTHWSLSGQVTGATRLSFNGAPLGLKEQSFMLSWDLQPGRTELYALLGFTAWREHAGVGG